MKKDKKSAAHQNHKPSELGMLIDSSMDDFRQYVTSISMGEVNGLKVILENVYLSLIQIKNQYLDVIGKLRESEDDSDKKKLKEYNEAFDGVYAEMMKIEEKSCYLTEYQNLHSKLPESKETSDLTTQ